MKPIKITNEFGETIEIEFNDDGVIKVRHSDIDPNTWGILHEYDKRMRQPSLKEFLTKKGVDMSNPLTARIAEAAGSMLGGYIVVDGKQCGISCDEVALIHAAVKQAGGILPNWSNQP